MIEIRGKRCLLVLEESEVLSLLPHDRTIWERALRRGKALKRARRREARAKARERRNEHDLGVDVHRRVPCDPGGSGGTGGN